MRDYHPDDYERRENPVHDAHVVHVNSIEIQTKRVHDEETTLAYLEAKSDPRAKHHRVFVEQARALLQVLREGDDAERLASKP